MPFSTLPSAQAPRSSAFGITISTPLMYSHSAGGLDSRCWTTSSSLPGLQPDEMVPNYSERGSTCGGASWFSEGFSAWSTTKNRDGHLFRSQPQSKLFLDGGEN